MQNIDIGNQTLEYIVHQKFVFHFIHPYGKVEDKSIVCVFGLSPLYLVVSESLFLLHSLLLSQAVLIFFSFHAKLCLSRHIWNVDERRKASAGKLKGRLFKCTMSFCLHLVSTLGIYGDSETSSHCLFMGSSHHPALSGEELKLLSREVFQRKLEMQSLIWLGLIIQDHSFMLEKVK